MKIYTDDFSRIQLFFEGIDMDRLRDLSTFAYLGEVNNEEAERDVYKEMNELLSSSKIYEYLDNPLNIPKNSRIRSALMEIGRINSRLVGFLLTMNYLEKKPLLKVDRKKRVLTMNRLVADFESAFKRLSAITDEEITRPKEADSNHLLFEIKVDGIYFESSKIESSNSKQSVKNGYYKLLKILLEKRKEGCLNEPIKNIFGSVSFHTLKNTLDKNTKGLWHHLKVKNRLGGTKQKIISFNMVDRKPFVTFINTKKSAI